MSDLALKDAQLAQALKENEQLKVTSRNMSAQLMSQKQCIDEYINANICLRAMNLLHEEDLRLLRDAVGQHAERLKVLEKENSTLKDDLFLYQEREKETNAD